MNECEGCDGAVSEGDSNAVESSDEMTAPEDSLLT